MLDTAILGANPYVCGDSMTIADVFGAQLVCVGELVRVDYERFPNVKRWIERMKALPAWKKVSAAHEGFVASLKEKPLVGL